MNYKNFKNLDIAVGASIEIWEVLAKLGCDKKELYFYSQIKHLRCDCPLCDIFGYERHKWVCRRCPLQSCVFSEDVFQRWVGAVKNNYPVFARHYAQQIVNKLKDYFVYEQIYTDYTEIEMREG